MDSTAYLQRQGWLGRGHALNSQTRPGGLIKPLLLAHKQDLLGVGKKKHDVHGDQWWSRAFDSVLKSVNNPDADRKTEAEKASEATAAAILIGQKNRHLAYASLYANFVKGEGLQGSLFEPKPPVSEVQVSDSKADRRARRTLKLAEQERLRQARRAARKLSRKSKSGTSKSSR